MKSGATPAGASGLASVCLLLGALAMGGTTATLSQDSAAAEAATGAKVEPLVPDRPDFTDGVLIVERPHIEAGVTFDRTGSVRETSAGEALVRLPLSERLELRVGVPTYLRIRDDGYGDSGFDNSFLGAKFRIRAPDNGKIGIAVLGGATLPTGSRSVAERGGLQPEIKLALAKEFTERIGLGVNAGTAREKDGGERFNSVFVSASLGISLMERVGGFVEVVVQSKVNANGDGARYVAAGLSYLVNPNLMVDVRLGHGAGNDFGSPDYFAGAGVSLRF